MKVVKPRTKKSPYQIKGTLPPPYENIEIRIMAHLNDLSGLACDYYENPEELGKLFLNRFLDPSIWEIISRFGFGNLPRGIHKQTGGFIQKMKIRAPYTYAIVDYWLKKPQKRWPKTIKKVIKEFESQRSLNFSHFGKERKKKPDTNKVTAYIMEKNFAKEREENNPASNPWTEDPISFKKNYISKTSFMKWLKMKVEDLEKSGIELPPNLPIVSDKPSDVILAIFS